jgi:MFS family permease
VSPVPTLRFVADNRRLLAFGLLTALFSSFGQTFFIGTFGDVLREEFSLSAGQFGGLYSLATLGSAIALTWTGRQFDRMPLRRYVTWVALGLVVACVLMSTARSVWMLGLALFAMRQTGQGLMSHTSSTSMARAFDSARGRALSIAVMGYPLGQAVLPAIVVAGMARVGWRVVWAVVAAAVLVGVVPLLRGLLRDGLGDAPVVEPERDGASGDGEADDRAGATRVLGPTPRADAPPVDPAGVTGVEWTRGRVLRDPRFWLVIPAAIAPGVILTGIFFHQAELVASKGWDMATWTALFTIFAACQIAGSLGAGPLVDRVTARAVLPFFLLPMTAGLVLFALGDGMGVWLAPAFLALQGITAGLSMTLGGALWAELYGVRHLGAIRATVTSFGILGTAASPVGMGALIDLGVGAAALAWLAVGYLALATMGVLVGLNLDRPDGLTAGPGA